MNKIELRKKYNEIAPWYDLLEGILEIMGVRQLRKRLLGRSYGKVLEVAAGTGNNFRYYPNNCLVTAMDMSREMLAFARKRVKRKGYPIQFSIMDAETLGFPDQSFDTVVSSLSLCTFSNPVATLQEMARVCRSDGRILLLEHGRSHCDRIGKWQDRRAPRHAEMLGCHWNREPLALVREAVLVPLVFSRTFFGIFHVIEAVRGENVNGKKG